MATWNQFHTVINGTKIRLDMLDEGGQTAGWVVRRACNVYQAYKPNPTRPDDGVVDLLTDGILVGQAGDPEGARQMLEQDLGMEDTATNKVLVLDTGNHRAPAH